MPPASLGGSPRSANGSDPGSFQITASVLCLGALEILHVPFKSGISIPYSPQFSRMQALLAFKARCPGLSFLVQNLDWGAQCGAWTPCFWGRTSAIVIILPFAGHLLRVWVLAVLHLYPSYPSCCGFFFIPLVVDKLFC